MFGLGTHMSILGIETAQTEPAIPPEVGGWLLLLCLGLIVVYPTSSLYHIFSHTIPNLIGAHSPARILLLSVYSVVFIVVAFFSIIAGLKLWLVKPGAVRFAKRYLLLYLIANITYFFFWMLIARPHLIISFAEMGWGHIVGPIGATVLWYFYLENSKRVRETYPTE